MSIEDDLADHQRLLAQRDAEIQRLESLRADWAQRAISLGDRLDALESQQAASVGGEREAFEAWVRREWPTAPLHFIRDALPKDDPRYGEYVTEVIQRAWVGWKARAALSPAGGGVVMPPRMTMEALGTITDVGAHYACDWYNRALDEVARLNAKPQAEVKP